MARFKPTHKGLKLLAVDFDQQILPGTFEHALCHLVDHELDLSALHARYQNDDGGASAYHPAALLKNSIGDRPRFNEAYIPDPRENTTREHGE